MAVRRPLIIDGGSIKELPSGDTLPGGGGLIRLSKTVADDDGALDIALTGGYSAYELRLSKFVPASNNRSLYLRTSVDGVNFDATSGDYASTYYGIDFSAYNGDSQNADYIHLASAIKTAYGAHGIVEIFPSDGTQYTNALARMSHYADYLGSAQMFLSSGVRKSATAITHVRVFFQAGNILSGEAHLFGKADGG